ncbi:MAG: CHASE3 domain-containing protein [Candidatus Obscuribacterales bacterium]|jgi:signal transduction histidine kinase|nr:CHASE3 domain-containing protein [Candidatus Obscuribacterales bacterium]
MLANLKLSHKGLILVSVPLLFELIFVFTLAGLLQQAENEVKEENRARAVVTHMHWLIRLFIDAGANIATYAITEDSILKERYAEAKRQLPQELNVLNDLLKDNPQQLKRLKHFKALSNHLIVGLEQAWELSKEHKKGEAIDYLKSLRISLKDLTIAAGPLIEVEQKIQAAAPATQARRRYHVQQLLIAGVAFNIILALFLAFYFNRGTARRLSVLMDNTKRLAEGRPLNPPLSGQDEIAHLDHVFNDMAKALTLAAEKREEAQHFKQEIMAMVSHDLKTPLTSMRGLIDLLQAGIYGELSEVGKKRLTLTERDIMRLIKMINNLLDSEKMEAGKLEMYFDNTSTKSIIERSIAAVQGFADEQSVTLKVPQADISFSGDEERLVQVLVNLLSNAIKFSAAGSTISLDLEKLDGLLKISVNDQGCGIPAQYQEAIFERFKQVADKERQNKRGTGLGLSICKSIIEQHHGKIGVDSSEGQGSTFWFTIPLTQTSLS